MRVGAVVALHASPNRDQIVLAHKDQLKLFSLYHNMEILSLKTKLPTKNLYSYVDVKWTIQNYIVSCCANGSLVVFNIHRSGPNKLERIFHEHIRTVNKLDCHSAEPLVLSGSLDCTCRLWDLRTKSRSVTRFDVKEPCRDVCFTSLDEFASTQEDGSIYRFDLRQPSAPVSVISAHSGSGLSLSYSNGLLASGGRDKTVKIWNTSKEHSKPLHTIYLDNMVGKLSWKPNSKILATCTLQNQGELQVWDAARHHVPISLISPHSDTILDFIWAKESDTILSVGKDNEFVQSVYTEGVNPRDKFPHGMSTCSQFGELVVTYDTETPIDSPSLKYTWRDKVLFASQPPLEESVKHHMSIHNFASPSLKTFVYYADHLMLSPEPQSLLCNEQVATRINDIQTAAHFRLLHILSSQLSLDPLANQAIATYFMQSILELANTNIQISAITIALLVHHLKLNRRLLSICHAYINQLRAYNMFIQSAFFLKTSAIDQTQTTKIQYNAVHPSTCSICNHPTNHLITGCIECGHISHIECFVRWFKSNQLCPAGCSCRCSV